MDLLGDLGGVVEVLTILFGIFLFPISEFSFILEASQKLFYARSTDKSLFKQPNDSEKEEEISKLTKPM